MLHQHGSSTGSSNYEQPGKLMQAQRARHCAPCAKRKVRRTVTGSARPATADTSYTADNAQEQVPRASQAAEAPPAQNAEPQVPRWVAVAVAARAWTHQRQAQDVQAAYWQAPAFRQAQEAGRAEDNRPRQPRQRAAAETGARSPWQRTRTRTTWG